MKKALSIILAVFCMLALSIPAFADAIVPIVPTVEEKSDSWLIVVLIAAVVIIGVVILVRAIRKKRK